MIARSDLELANILWSKRVSRFDNKSAQCRKSLPSTLQQPDMDFGQFKRLLKTFLFV